MSNIEPLSTSHLDFSLLERLNIPSFADFFSIERSDFNFPAWRDTLEHQIDVALASHVSIRETVYARSQAADALLVYLFQHFELDKTSVALIAVGGYGRGEMLPHSDVDILLLSPESLDDSETQKIEAFVAKLWDIKLDVGVSVRSIAECIEAAEDITVATALLESRYLVGNPTLQNTAREIHEQVWSPSEFYHAKQQEVIARYRKHNSTEYNLEPDIKNAPGGLRDIHYIGWITKRHFRINRLYDLVSESFLTDKEYTQFVEAETFLWLIRHHLHRLTSRNENRLLFDYQRDIAKTLDYRQNDHPNAAVEHFMRNYYRSAMQISTLSEMLSLLYYESLIEPKSAVPPKTTPLNERFVQIGDKIAVTDSRLFASQPSSILELFLLMGKHSIKNIRAKTLRLLKLAAPSIDYDFRHDPVNKSLFIDNLREQNYLFHRLRLMKRYDILGHYIPNFSHVTGLMQYDLFHRYTVDAHTLLLVRVLHRFTDPKYADAYPTVSALYQKIERKELLVLAAIFHDIAKGRGGDHSELGSNDAYDFCRQHGLSDADAKLVAWLCEHHLLMSMTSQKQDTSDPEVVADFARKVNNLTHLNYLYVLTAADMTATNPELWNSWHATLMSQLYKQARRIMKADISMPVNRESLIDSTREAALTLLDETDQIDLIKNLWEELGDEYFIRETPYDIVWHSRSILAHDDPNSPLITLREHRELALDAVQVFIYTQDKPNLFAATMTVFDQMNLDVLDARIITATRDFALDSYVLLDKHGTLLADKDRQQSLIDSLLQSLAQPELPTQRKRWLPRRLKNFQVETTIQFKLYPNLDMHVLLLETLDRPGLLATISMVFLEHNVEVHYARITTLGERAEDVFYLSDHQDQPLSHDKLEQLEAALYDALDIT